MESEFSQTFRFLSSLKQETPTVPCLLYTLRIFFQQFSITSSVADPEPDPHHFVKLDPHPHQSGKLDPYPYQSEKHDPDPQQSKEVEALEGHFRAMEGPNLGNSE
jgi:hypothetical protein